MCEQICLLHLKQHAKDFIHTHNFKSVAGSFYGARNKCLEMTKDNTKSIRHPETLLRSPFLLRLALYSRIVFSPSLEINKENAWQSLSSKKEEQKK